MRRKGFVLHIYENDRYKKLIVFNSRTLLNSYLRKNGGIFRTDALTDIGDGIISIPTQGAVRYEVEELAE